MKGYGFKLLDRNRMAYYSLLQWPRAKTWTHFERPTIPCEKGWHLARPTMRSLRYWIPRTGAWVIWWAVGEAPGKGDEYKCVYERAKLLKRLAVRQDESWTTFAQRAWAEAKRLGFVK